MRRPFRQLSIRKFMKQSLKLVILAISLSCGQLALAQSSEDAHAEEVLAYTVEGVVARYPADSIQSVETANAALAEVQEARAKLEARFEAEQQQCYPKFFTTACLNKATERKRLDLQLVKKIEIEANAYIRHARVEKRDRKLEEKARERAAKNKADPILTAPQPEEAAAPAAPAADAVDPERKQKADAYAKRVADHEKRLQQLEQERQAGAAERAANVEKYEAKQKEAAERQRKVAERKAEKEKAEAARQAKAAAEANRPPPTPGE